MTRKEILLAALARGATIRAFQPVHAQKVMFLIDQHDRDLFDADSRYSFTPYDYGPFDSQVYHDLDALERDGDVSVDKESGYGYRLYSATPAGVERGRALLNQMPEAHRQSVERIVDVVLPLGFRELVAAIYRSYPDMKVNSVFNG